MWSHLPKSSWSQSQSEIILKTSWSHPEVNLKSSWSYLEVCSKIWARKVKIWARNRKNEYSRQLCAERTDGQTDGQSDTMSSCRSQQIFFPSSTFLSNWFFRLDQGVLLACCFGTGIWEMDLVLTIHVHTYRWFWRSDRRHYRGVWHIWRCLHTDKHHDWGQIQ